MGHPSPDAKRLRWRRARALLASGLVLGVGGAVTLAAWNDSEYGTATFTAGSFGIEGSTDGTTFESHEAESEAAQLSLSSSPLFPGATTYALFSVRTVTDSVAGTATLTGADTNGDGLGAELAYGVSTIAGTDCNATAFAAGTVVILAGSPLTADATTSQPLPAAAAGQVNYCFAITMHDDAPNDVQGDVLDAHWEVVGTSS